MTVSNNSTKTKRILVEDKEFDTFITACAKRNRPNKALRKAAKLANGVRKP